MALCSNDLGGATVAAQYTPQDQASSLALFAFDAAGQLVRRLKIDSAYWYPTVDILEQGPSGNYQIWGSGDLVGEDGIVSVEGAAYRLIVDSQGNVVSDEMAAITGNCIKYKHGKVYTYQIDSDQHAISPFIPSEGPRSSCFKISVFNELSY